MSSETTAFEKILAELDALDAYSKDTTTFLKKLDTIIDKLSLLINGTDNNTGHSTEEYFFNALAETMQFADIHYDFIEHNIKRSNGKIEGMYDIVLFNDSSLAIIEVKHRAHPNDLESLTTKKVGSFRMLYPEYAGYKIYLGLAGFSFSDVIIKQAKELGVGILKQNGKTIEYATDHLKEY
jgi:hypothetical protein